MIYLAAFAISVMFAYFANKTEKKNLFYIFSVASVAVMVLLAGLRDFSVGIDTMNYMEKKLYWDGAIKSATFTDYIFSYLKSGFGEPLFAVLVGMAAHFTGDYSVFLLLVHTIIITCIYIGAMRLRKWINPTVMLLIFYLFFFNQSLNILRQYVAMSIIFAFFADLLDKKYLKFAIVVLVSLSMHVISVVAFGFLIMHFVMYYEKMPFTLKQREIGIAALLFLAVVGFKPLVKIAMSVGVLSRRYDFIFSKYEVEPAIIVFGMTAIGLAAALYFRKEMAAKCEYSDFFIMCSACYLIMLMLTFTVATTKRIALTFGFADVATLSLIQSSQTEKRKKILVTAGVLGMALVYWLYVYAFRNASETFPYNVFFLMQE